jgi:hypothetical protein
MKFPVFLSSLLGSIVATIVFVNTFSTDNGTIVEISALKYTHEKF